MEQNPVKKVWRLVRVVYFMLRKRISKRKLLLDLNMMIKRGKIASKALQNLMAFSTNRRSHDSHHLSSPLSSESEFSCTNSPSSLFSKKQPGEDLETMAVSAVVLKAMEMIHSENASPELPGFRRSPMVRQLRVTDSPFPLNSVADEDNHVDEAAERFIIRFYNDLRQQKTN